MKQRTFLKGFVCALVVVPALAAGCKKKETAATEGSAAPTGSAGSAGSGAVTPATGSGSAVADTAGSGSAAAGSAAGSAAAAPAVPWASDSAPAPATSKVTGKRKGNDEGTFDRALYFKNTDKWGSTNYTVEISSKCDKFSCAHFDSSISWSNGTLQKDCPDAKVMEVKLSLEADPKPGPVDVDISINGFTSGGGLTSSFSKGGSLTEVTDKEIKGKIDFKDDGGKDQAHGQFAAKVCGTIVVPKQ